MNNFLSFTWNPIEGIPVGGYTIRFYSLMFVVAIVFATAIMKYILKAENQDIKLLDSLQNYSILGMVIGMRLGEVFFYNWDYFKNHLLEAVVPIMENPNVFLINIFDLHLIKGWEFIGFRGLASHGATIGFIIAFAIFWKKYLKKQGKKFFWLYDRICISIALGGSFVRLGNFFNSEMVGFETSKELPWAVQFLKMHSSLGSPYAYRHPAQLYESIGYFLIFVLLMTLYIKTNAKDKNGFLFGLFFILLWSVRFFVEFFKLAQVEDRVNWVLNTGQLLSIPFIIIGFIILVVSLKEGKPININKTALM